MHNMEKELKNAKKVVDEIAGVIKADFSINRLQMDAKLAWLLDLEVKKVLPETFLQYKLDLVFNEEPYLKNIERIEEEIKEIEQEASLFETEKSHRIKTRNKQIMEVREDMVEIQNNCPTIQMLVSVTEIKYKSLGTTFVRMRLPDNKISELNDNKHKFSYYVAELTPFKEEPDLEALGIKPYKDN